MTTCPAACPCPWNHDGWSSPPWLLCAMWSEWSIRMAKMWYFVYLSNLREREGRNAGDGSWWWCWDVAWYGMGMSSRRKLQKALGCQGFRSAVLIPIYIMSSPCVPKSAPRVINSSHHHSSPHSSPACRLLHCWSSFVLLRRADYYK